MSARATVASWLWKIPACGMVYAGGVMIGVMLTQALDLRLPTMPVEVDPTWQMILLFVGGMAMALGLAAMAVGLSGRLWERWLALAAFAFVVNGVANGLEASIFTTLGGEPAAVLMALPASLLGALAVSYFFPALTEASLVGKIAGFRPPWGRGSLIGRLLLAVVAFPVCYFLFGMLVAPIVVSHYESLEFLVIPPMTTMLGVLFVRSALFLLVSLPILLGWAGSRRGLVIGLGLGHFAAVGLHGLVQAEMLPAVLRWTHGIEILVDSMVYAWLLVWLLVPRQPAEGESVEGADAAG